MAAKIYVNTGKHEDRNGTDAFIKIKEAAKLVGRPEVSVYYAVKHGHIKHIKAPNIKGPYGFLYLVKREDVIKWASYQNKTCDSHEPGKGTVPAKAETNVGYLSSKEAAKLVNFLLNDPEMALLQNTEKGIPISKTARETLEKEGKLNNIDYVASEQMFNYGDKLKIMQPILEKEDVFLSFFNGAAYYIYDEKSLDETAEDIYNKMYKINK